MKPLEYRRKIGSLPNRLQTFSMGKYTPSREVGRTSVSWVERAITRSLRRNIPLQRIAANPLNLQESAQSQKGASRAASGVVPPARLHTTTHVSTRDGASNLEALCEETNRIVYAFMSGTNGPWHGRVFLSCDYTG
jgi:hypothetical protein